MDHDATFHGTVRDEDIDGALGDASEGVLGSSALVWILYGVYNGGHSLLATAKVLLLFRIDMPTQDHQMG